MHGVRTGSVIALLLSCPSLAAATAWQREQGVASSPGDGHLLYRETHYVAAGDATDRWVLYRCPDGRVFARKHVQAATRSVAPDFALADGRDGYREGVRGEPASRTVFVQRPGRAVDALSLAVPANGVIDAGFDAAVRAHWDALMRGDPLRLQFLVPSRQRFFPVRVERSASVDWHGGPAEMLRMRLDSWLGAVVPDVQLVYGREDRRLLQFTGTGNVRDARGRNPQVRIAFAAPPAAATAQEVAQALALPLDGRCRF